MKNERHRIGLSLPAKLLRRLDDIADGDPAARAAFMIEAIERHAQSWPRDEIYPSTALTRRLDKARARAAAGQFVRWEDVRDALVDKGRKGRAKAA